MTRSAWTTNASRLKRAASEIIAAQGAELAVMKKLLAAA